jgi:hypothetical protein
VKGTVSKGFLGLVDRQIWRSTNPKIPFCTGWACLKRTFETSPSPYKRLPVDKLAKTVDNWGLDVEKVAMSRG